MPGAITSRSGRRKANQDGMGSNGTLSNVAVQHSMADTGRMKRTVQVNVKMTEEDFALLRKAAEKRWPDAVMTNSGIVLALAKIAAIESSAR
jgi:hypothetical protein